MDYVHRASVDDRGTVDMCLHTAALEPVAESVRESIAGRLRQPAGPRHWSPRTMDCKRRPLVPRPPLVLRNVLAEMWGARCETYPFPPWPHLSSGLEPICGQSR